MKLKFALLPVLVAVILVGCGGGGAKSGADRTTMTKGHVAIGVSDAATDLVRFLSRQFEATYPDAFVDVMPRSTAMLIDSLLSERTEQVFLDRMLTPPETSAFAQAKLTLLQYKIAYYPVYLMIPKADSVRVIDSLSLRRILSGAVTNWRDLGGTDQEIHVYLPAPRSGAWESLMGYLGNPDSVTATACTTHAEMLERAASDPGALMVWSKPFDQLKDWRPLRFRRGEVEHYPDAETILLPQGYPFSLTLTYATTHRKDDVAAGFLTFCSGNVGQRALMEAMHYRPAAVPVKIVRKKT